MSDVDFSGLRTLTARRLMNALRRDGFELERQSGSHRQYYHSDRRRVTISFHRQGETFPAATLRRIILEQARWGNEDLRRLHLL